MRNIALFLLLSILLLSCSRQEKPQALEPNPVAEVTAVSGEVRTFVNGEWSAAVAGWVLLATDSLDVPAAASCELKDVNKRAVLISGAAKDDVAKLLAAGAPVPAPAPAVKPLASLKKLADKPKFEVATPTAVAGVRGVKGRQIRRDTTRTDSASHH
jgi:hypothetical protein